jgi:hypothetical protein
MDRESMFGDGRDGDLVIEPGQTVDVRDLYGKQLRNFTLKGNLLVGEDDVGIAVRVSAVLDDRFGKYLDRITMRPLHGRGR